MPCEAGGVPSCKKYQIASDTRFAGYLFEALLRIETLQSLKSYAINLIRWKRKYNKQGGVGREQFDETNYVCSNGCHYYNITDTVFIYDICKWYHSKRWWNGNTDSTSTDSSMSEADETKFLFIKLKTAGGKVVLNEGEDQEQRIRLDKKRMEQSI